MEHFKSMKTDEKLTQKWEQVSKQQAQIKSLNKDIETMEFAVVGLNSEMERVKEDTDQIDNKIVSFGKEKINPLID